MLSMLANTPWFQFNPLRLMNASDQILSHITPSVIVPLAQPDANPIKEYLNSLARLESLPSDTLVLPSHGIPFRALHARLAQLREHHQMRLDDVDPSLPAIPAHL